MSGAPDVAVISDGLWKRLGAAPSIIGSTLTLTSVPYTVIVVMPPDFQFSGSSSSVKPDLYAPYTPDPATQRGIDTNFRARRSPPSVPWSAGATSNGTTAR